MVGFLGIQIIEFAKKLPWDQCGSPKGKTNRLHELANTESTNTTKHYVTHFVAAAVPGVVVPDHRELQPRPEGWQHHPAAQS